MTRSITGDFETVAANDYYFRIRPLIPRSLRMVARRWVARHQRKVSGVWPIHQGAATKPANWKGWPKQHQFALTLTHDVESALGTEQIKPIMDLEMSFGLRSAFFLVPESYPVSPDLRKEIRSRGFEVGVHGLKHDGRLFSSRKIFRERSIQINRYLDEWDAVGFRSPFMHHNLRWAHDLNIQYDASTFDTDPFEPQPDGANTIFPFYVNGLNGRGYVEIPYTIPQDSTLFLVLGCDSIEVWKQKLDWVAARGGLVLLTVHPDYVNLENRFTARSFPIALYKEFLEYVTQNYAGSFWHALPRQINEFIRTSRESSLKTGEHGTNDIDSNVPKNIGLNSSNSPTSDCTIRIENGCVSDEAPGSVALDENPYSPCKIWIDLDNTPHVPLFKPVIRELRRRGYQVVTTARDAFQVRDLAALLQVPAKLVGRHYGKSSFMKVAGLIIRAIELFPFTVTENPTLAVSHGSRAQLLLCNFLRIDTLLLADYEHAIWLPLVRPKWTMMPVAIPAAAAATPDERVAHYDGIKEDMYVGDFVPDPEIYKQLELNPDNLIITVRPPANEAHYHNKRSEELLIALMESLSSNTAVQVVLLPRNTRQEQDLRNSFPHWFTANRTIIPKHAVDGLNLLWHSDAVVSGGGTINREAAALGLPVYSIFCGKPACVDLWLEKQERLVILRSVNEVRENIQFKKRDKRFQTGQFSGRAVLDQVVNHIEKLATEIMAKR